MEQKSKNMIISEQKGRIDGFQHNEGGFQFQVEAYPVDVYGVSYFFPFNQNRPKAIDPDEFRGKRVKITVEMEEDRV